MNKKQIKDLALSNGFKLKEQPSGEMDLNPYVYEFADALLAKANKQLLKTDDGIHNKESCDAAMIGQLRNQLAKANERVKELEKESLAFRSILDQSNRFHPNTDKMYSSGFKDAMRLFEDIYLGDAQQALNKFAIEKKIEGAYAVISLLDETKDSKAILMANKYVREQLRKEQVSE